MGPHPTPTGRRESKTKRGATNGDNGQKNPATGAADNEDDDAVSGVLPPLAEGDRLELRALRPEQKFTQPPPRFTEATLVKELEENGIGRPIDLRVDHRRPAGPGVTSTSSRGVSSRRHSGS